MIVVVVLAHRSALCPFSQTGTIAVVPPLFVPLVVWEPSLAPKSPLCVWWFSAQITTIVVYAHAHGLVAQCHISALSYSIAAQDGKKSSCNELHMVPAMASKAFPCKNTAPDVNLKHLVKKSTKH
jgi:hypothetical protein